MRISTSAGGSCERTALLALRADHAALRFEVALLRFHLALQRH